MPTGIVFFFHHLQKAAWGKTATQAFYLFIAKQGI